MNESVQWTQQLHRYKSLPLNILGCRCQMVSSFGTIVRKKVLSGNIFDWFTHAQFLFSIIFDFFKSKSTQLSRKLTLLFNTTLAFSKACIYYLEGPWGMQKITLGSPFPQCTVGSDENFQIWGKKIFFEISGPGPSYTSIGYSQNHIWSYFAYIGWGAQVKCGGVGENGLLWGISV